MAWKLILFSPTKEGEEKYQGKVMYDLQMSELKRHKMIHKNAVRPFENDNNTMEIKFAGKDIECYRFSSLSAQELLDNGYAW